MGQKTHPHGLRIGIHRKWNDSWFIEKKSYKDFFFTQHFLESLFKNFLNFIKYNKRSFIEDVFLVDLKLFKHSKKLYVFIFFYKWRQNKKI
jgi:hypothetical protein